jgi:hypothetical protein
MGGFFNSFTNWASRPFNSEMNVLNWALFVGLILVLVILWSRVLKSMEG